MFARPCRRGLALGVPLVEDLLAYPSLPVSPSFLLFLDAKLLRGSHAELSQDHDPTRSVSLSLTQNKNKRKTL